MDLEQTFAALYSKNGQLRQENDQLKAMLSLVKENRDLRARMHSFNDNTVEELTVCSASAGRNPPGLWQNTCDEKQFRKEFQQMNLKHEHRTSSPVDFESFIQNSVHADTSEIQTTQADIPLEVKDPDRLLGEIAYQLDRRILFHIFQGHRRLYGFTMLNIPGKIIEMSTHPLTGKVDEGYRLHLTQRYDDLMESLNQLGYKTMLHPPFAEFIVNTYGILTQRPSDCRTQETDYNNPEFLRKIITARAPRQLQKDLLLLLTCLCNMAEKDKRPLLLW
uniref:speriolin-like protein n=1 Tax=Scatophagus argus TaxID=75038 RepID=UPI001ED84FD4|nr:speriolin-like protein [Scatophagus argus]